MISCFCATFDARASPLDTAREESTVFQVCRYMCRQIPRPTNSCPVKINFVVDTMGETPPPPAINDLYGMPPLAIQGTYVKVDTILHYFILSQKLDGNILLVKLLLWWGMLDYWWALIHDEQSYPS
jgi:hypothetical protein